MLMTKEMRNMMKECSKHIVKQYDILGSIEKMSDVLIEIGNDIPKNFFKTSLEILNTKVEVKAAFNEKVDVRNELSDIIANTFNAIMDADVCDLPRIGKILDKHFGDLV